MGIVISAKGRTTYGRSIVSDGLQLYFDAGNYKSYVSGSTKCYDLSAFQYITGTLTTGDSGNMVTFSTEMGGCFGFPNGGYFSKSGYINFSTHWVFASLWTVSAWFKTTNTVSYSGMPLTNPIVGELEDSSMSAAGVDGGNIKLFYYAYGWGAIGWQLVDSGIYVADGRWHNVTMKLNYNGYVNPGEWRVWVDGQNLYNNSLLYGLGSTWLDGIGTTRYGGGFDGFIANVQIWGRLLSDTEILQNYNALKGRYGL